MPFATPTTLLLIIASLVAALGCAPQRGPEPIAPSVTPATIPTWTTIPLARSDATQASSSRQATPTAGDGRPMETWPDPFVVDPVNDRIVVAAAQLSEHQPPQDGWLEVYAHRTWSTSSVYLGRDFNPLAIAINPTAGKIYVTNGVLIDLVDAGTLSVTESRALLNAKGLLSMVVSPSSGHIYGIIPDGPLIVLDGDSMAIVATISVPEGVSGIAIDIVTNRIYLIHRCRVSTGGVCYAGAALTIVDGVSNHIIATVPLSENPLSVAVNSLTHRAYVGSNSGVVVVDGVTRKVISLLSTSPVNAIGVDDQTNHVLAVNTDRSTLSVLDGATGAHVSEVVLGCDPRFIAVDPSRRSAYIMHSSGRLAAVWDLPTGFIPHQGTCRYLDPSFLCGCSGNA